jgi:hypothetical protein
VRAPPTASPEAAPSPVDAAPRRGLPPAVWIGGVVVFVVLVILVFARG